MATSKKTNKPWKMLTKVALSLSVFVSGFSALSSDVVHGAINAMPEYDFENPRDNDGNIIDWEDLFQESDDYIQGEVFVDGRSWVDLFCEPRNSLGRTYVENTYYTQIGVYKPITYIYQRDILFETFIYKRTMNATPKFQEKYHNGNTYQGLLFRDESTYINHGEMLNQNFYSCGDDFPEGKKYGTFERAHEVWFFGKLYNTQIPIVTGKHGSEGDATGVVKWKLQRLSPNENSSILTEHNFSISGTHYATKALTSKVTVNGGQAPVTASKNSNLTVNNRYDYTNYWKLVCGETSCSKVPDWSKQETFDKDLSFTIAVDYKVFKEANTITALNGITSWQTGETITINSVFASEFSKSETREQVTITDEFMDKQELVTQTGLPVKPDSLGYTVAVPFGSESMSTAFRGTGMFGFYHPLDTDEYLKDHSKPNLKTYYNDIDKLGDSRVSSNDMGQKARASSKGEHMIPFAQSTLSGNSATFQTDITGLAEHTGYLSTFSRFNAIRSGFASSNNAPSVQSSVSAMVTDHKEQYVTDVDYVYLDNVMYTDSNFDEKKLQRYYIPLEIDALYEPNTEYSHYTHIYDIGLNDTGIGFNRIFTFQNYLVGVGGANVEGSGVGYLLNESSERQVSAHNLKYAKAFNVKSNEKNSLGINENKRDDLEKLFRIRYIDRDYMDKGRIEMNRNFSPTPFTFEE